MVWPPASGLFDQAAALQAAQDGGEDSAGDAGADGVQQFVASASVAGWGADDKDRPAAADEPGQGGHLVQVASRQVAGPGDRSWLRLGRSRAAG